MDTREMPPRRQVPRPVHPAAPIVGGPLLALAAYGACLALADRSTSGAVERLTFMVAAVTPFLGGLLLRERLAVRVSLALLFAFCGAVFFLCAGFPMWLAAGAPGFSPG